MRKLSIVIPCFNERNTLQKIVQKVKSIKITEIETELIIVDDKSTDGSRDILRNYIDCDIKLFNESNLGKGASLKKGISAASGDIILVQDADLEYDPVDIPLLLNELKDKEDIVFGSRYLEVKRDKSFSILYWGGRLITVLVNLTYGQKLTDVSTCYKLFYKEAYDKLKMTSSGFEFCVELTAKALSQKYNIKEVQINYFPRTKSEGKKINSIDGIKCLYTLFKIFLLKRS